MDKYCIVREHSGRLVYGKLLGFKNDGSVVTLEEARKIYFSPGSLSPYQLAHDGFCDIEQCSFSVKVPEMYIMWPEEVLLCSETASHIINSYLEKPVPWRRGDGKRE